jgi:hypothetical protein
VVQEPETAPVEVVEPEAPAKAPKKDAHSEAVSIGSVECRLKRLPLEVVLGLLTLMGCDELRRRNRQPRSSPRGSVCLIPMVVLLPSSSRTATLRRSSTATQELAAAEDCGVNEVSVILVPAGGASDAQSHIVEMVRQQRDQGTSEDDELFYRVHAEG